MSKENRFVSPFDFLYGVVVGLMFGAALALAMVGTITVVEAKEHDGISR
jgi:tetrahydromethanopterin S-methyltransferase subunit B